MHPENLYKGFSPEKQAEHEQWLVDHHGPSVRQGIEHSRRHVGSWTDAQLQERIQELATLEAALAGHCRQQTPPADPRLRPLLERHRQWVASMWGRPCTPGEYAGLAELYGSHPDFRARYESLAPGFADYLPAAMRACSAQAA